MVSEFGLVTLAAPVGSAVLSDILLSVGGERIADLDEPTENWLEGRTTGRSRRRRGIAQAGSVHLLRLEAEEPRRLVGGENCQSIAVDSDGYAEHAERAKPCKPKFPFCSQRSIS